MAAQRPAGVAASGRPDYMRAPSAPLREDLFLAVADPATPSRIPPSGMAGPLPRLVAIDCVRGLALIAMVVYHIAFDLYSDRLIAADVVDDFGWKALARATAGTFLLLVGIGLTLATRNGLNPRRYFRRLGLIAGGAILVSVATWWFDPGTFVFFGVLHEIAVASVLALPFLWLPSFVVLVAGAAIIALPFFFASPLFDLPALWWVGLSTTEPVTVDYVPVFPWLGVVLLGLVAGRVVLAHAATIARFQPKNAALRALAFGGRHTLLLYLVHQPLIVGALSLAMAILPPPSKDVLRARFVGQCSASCGAQGNGAPFCGEVCGCLFDRIYGTDLYALKSVGDMSAGQRTRWNGIVDACQTGQ
jgi:uncharacterized membrane protein